MEFCQSKKAVDFLAPISVKANTTHKNSLICDNFNPCLLALEYTVGFLVYRERGEITGCGVALVPASALQVA